MAFISNVASLRNHRLPFITRTLTRSDALTLKSPDPPSNPDVFQEVVNGPQRSAKTLGGSATLVSQSPPRSPSPNPRPPTPKMQPKVMVHPGIIPLASHLISSRRMPRQLGKSLTLTTSGLNSSSSSTTKSSSSGRSTLGF